MALAPLLARVWGLGFWIYLFVDCVAVEWHRALQPFVRRDLSGWQWLGLWAIAVALLLVEGLRAFQRSFAPMLVRRARELTGWRAYEICGL